MFHQQLHFVWKLKAASTTVGVGWLVQKRGQLTDLVSQPTSVTMLLFEGISIQEIGKVSHV